MWSQANQLGGWGETGWWQELEWQWWRGAGFTLYFEDKANIMAEKIGGNV